MSLGPLWAGALGFYIGSTGKPPAPTVRIAMQALPRDTNPFALLLDPQAVLAQIEHSERLERLQRRVCRPLDRPMLGALAEDGDESTDTDTDTDTDIDVDIDIDIDIEIDTAAHTAAGRPVTPNDDFRAP